MSKVRVKTIPVGRTASSTELARLYKVENAIPLLVTHRYIRIARPRGRSLIIKELPTKAEYDFLNGPGRGFAKLPDVIEQLDTVRKWIDSLPEGREYDGVELEYLHKLMDAAHDVCHEADMALDRLSDPE